MIHFEHPYLLYLLVLIPIFIIIYIIVKRNQNKRLAAFADKQMFERLTPDVSHSKAVYGQSSLAGYSPWDHKDLDTTERLTLSWNIKTF